MLGRLCLAYRKARPNLYRERLRLGVAKSPTKPNVGSCDLSMKLSFLTGGADMITVLGVDATWAYSSNGRLEREYPDGISSLLVETRTGREAVH